MFLSKEVRYILYMYSAASSLNVCQEFQITVLIPQREYTIASSKLIFFYLTVCLHCQPA